MASMTRRQVAELLTRARTQHWLPAPLPFAYIVRGTRKGRVLSLEYAKIDPHEVLGPPDCVLYGAHRSDLVQFHVYLRGQGISEGVYTFKFLVIVREVHDLKAPTVLFGKTSGALPQGRPGTLINTFGRWGFSSRPRTHEGEPQPGTLILDDGTEGLQRLEGHFIPCTPLDLVLDTPFAFRGTKRWPVTGLEEFYWRLQEDA